MKETVRTQERQLIDCAEGGPNTNQLLLPRHLTPSVNAPEPPESDWDDPDWNGPYFAPSQNCKSMDGAQGAYPGGGTPNNTDYGNRQTGSSEEQVRPKTALEGMVASMEALTEALNTKQNETTSAERKEVCFADDEELRSLFGMSEAVVGGGGFRINGTP